VQGNKIWELFILTREYKNTGVVKGKLSNKRQRNCKKTNKEKQKKHERARKRFHHLHDFPDAGNTHRFF